MDALRFEGGESPKADMSPAIAAGEPAQRAGLLNLLRPLATHLKETLMNREAFGLWLLSEKDRGDWIDDLADAARADRKFPKDGTPDAVRKRLSEMGAEGDMFERVDDAEAAWINAREL